MRPGTEQDDNDRILRFSDEQLREEQALEGEPGIPEEAWQVLIVDDEEEVHRVTRLVLGDFRFHGRPLQFLSAHSLEEARRLLQENPGIALILLDVVMEGERSGLDLVRFVRDELKNRKVRIILRTGQPGQAPEEIIILSYDINDYKEKTELSSRRLLTSVVSALRAYRDIETISRLNESLEEKVRRRTEELQKANQKLSESLRKIEEDQQAGRRIQYRLLPARNSRFGDYEFSRYLLSSTNLSGDFLDYFEIDERYLGFYIADVSGHGLSSAFVTVLLKRFVFEILNRYRTVGERVILEPPVVLERLNRELIRENLGKYLTIFYGLIDRERNRMIYSNGGQFPFPMLCDTRSTESLSARSFPVGLFKFSKYPQAEIDLPPSFVFMLISDGILEVLPQERVEDKYRFLESLIVGPETTIARIMQALDLDRLREIPDDITFLMIKRTVE